MRALNILYISVRADVGGGPAHLSSLLMNLHEDSSFNFFTATPLEFPHAHHYKEFSQEHIEIPKRTFSVHSLNKLLSLINDKKIDIVHSHGRGAGIYSRLLGFLSRRKPKIIHTFHGVHDQKSMKNIVALCIERILSYLTHKFIAVSQAELTKAWKLSLIDHYSKATVIHNSVTQKSITFPKNTNLGILCRFDRIKNIEGAIHFFKSRSDQFSMLLIAGAGDYEYEQSLRNLVRVLEINDRVQFLGEISDLTNFFSQIGTLISLSLSEGMPLAPLEAISYERDLILSSIPPHLEIIYNTEGKIIEENDEFIHFSPKGLACIFTEEEQDRRIKSVYQEYI